MNRMFILQVEDEETDVVLLEMAFHKLGINPTLYAVSTGREAIEYLAGEGRFADRQRYPLPELVLLDLNLPVVDGFQVLEWMRRQSHLKAVVVVTLTSSGLEEDIRRAYELGTNSYVVKPASQQGRVEFVRGLHGWWMELNRYAGVALAQ